MSIKVIAKNRGTSKQDATFVVEESASQYVAGMVSAGFTGSVRKTVEALEAGFPVVVDQFDIVVEQQAD